MKVLHGITRLGGGGSERQARNLACTLAGRGISQVIFAFKGGSFHEDLTRAGCKVYLSALSRWRLPLAVTAIMNIVKDEKPDILQSWDPAYDVLFGLAAKRHNVRFIASERNSELMYYLPDGFGKAWYRHLRAPVIRATAKMVIANSQSGKRYIDKITNNSVKCAVIYNGIDIDRILETSTVPPVLPKGVENFVTVANRLSKPKRTQLAVEIFQKLLEVSSFDSRSLSLLIMGTGPEEADLRNFCQRLPIAHRIHFMGNVPLIAPFVAQSRAFMSASMVEGMPNSVLEAMVTGTPSVISQIEPHQELYDISKGGVLLFDSQSQNSGVAALERSLHDEAERKILQSRSITFSRQLTIERMVSEFVKIYQSVLE